MEVNMAKEMSLEASAAATVKWFNQRVRMTRGIENGALTGDNWMMGRGPPSQC